MFHRYDQDRDNRVNYREFCRLLVPNDKILANLLVGRCIISDRISFETQEIFKRLLRAHLSLEQAHEYLRQRLARVRRAENWSLHEIYDVLDAERKGHISVYDLEKLIIEHKKSGSRTLVDDIELVITMYDMSGYGNIQYVDF